MERFSECSAIESFIGLIIDLDGDVKGFLCASAFEVNWLVYYRPSNARLKAFAWWNAGALSTFKNARFEGYARRSAGVLSIFKIAYFEALPGGGQAYRSHRAISTLLSRWDRVDDNHEGDGGWSLYYLICLKLSTYT
ncbi:hypothetical protein JOM56_012102 [Amanita muscaria]